MESSSKGFLLVVLRDLIETFTTEKPLMVRFNAQRRLVSGKEVSRPEIVAALMKLWSCNRIVSSLWK